jgi:hypothetical protein
MITVTGDVAALAVGIGAELAAAAGKGGSTSDDKLY